MPLPDLREDLDLHSGPRQGDGQPTWTLHDTSRNRFFQIDWMTFEILNRWSLGDPDRIVTAVHTGTTLNVTPENVISVAEFLKDNQLLRPGLGQAAAMAGSYQKMKGTAATQALHSYLFFRVPLVRPDRFLDWLLPKVEFFYSRGFFLLTFAAFAAAAAGIYREWDRFTVAFLDNLSLSGIVSYSLAIIAVKTAHEFGHALTAKRYGCRIPTMGVALLVLWPVLYTDTGEVWLLKDKKQRLAVAAAGVTVELAIAVWAALAWTLLPDGHLRAMTFVLAAISWLGTVAINASPFMRYDGYFLLADWLNIPNLHNRAFALARWDLRERLFNLGEERPEYFPPARHRALVIFAWLIWLYRLTLFLGIAVLVYHFFIKAVGIFLFVVEIGWFVLRPVAQEMKEWKKRGDAIRKSPRTARSALLAALLIGAALVPWPGHVATMGTLRPADKLVLQSPKAAQVTKIAYKEGDGVDAGETVISLRSPDLDAKLADAKARVKNLQWLASSAGLNEETRANLPLYQSALAAAEAEQKSIEKEAGRLTLSTTFKGVLRDLQPELEEGQWVPAGEPLATVVGPDKWTAEAYLDEDSVHRIATGDAARFYPESGDGPSVALTVASIDGDATRAFNDGFYALQNGGPIAMREKNRQFIPEHAVYRVTFSASDPPPATQQHSWRGQIVISGSSEAILAPYFRAALSVIWREMGF